MYFSAFEIENNQYKQVHDYTAESISYLINTFSNTNKNILFVGDGVDAYKNKLLEALSKKCLFAPNHLNQLKSSSICKAAYDKLITGNKQNSNLSPLYLRKSQAERMLETKDVI